MNKVDFHVVYNKAYTLLMSRRFWNSIFSILFLVLAGPSAAEHADALSQQAVDIVTLLVQIVGPLLVMLNLINSYTVRPPTNSDYQITPTVDEAVQVLVNNAQN